VCRTSPEEVRRLLALARVSHAQYSIGSTSGRSQLGARIAELLNPNGDGADLSTPEAIRRHWWN